MRTILISSCLLALWSPAGCASRRGTLQLWSYGADAGKYQTSSRLTDAVYWDALLGYIPHQAYPVHAIGESLDWQHFHAFGYSDMTGRKYVWKVGGVSGVFIEDPAPAGQ